MKRLNVTRLALISEGIIASVALIWIWLREVPISLSYSHSAALYGVVAVTPILIINIALFVKLGGSHERYSTYRTFVERMVIPLCQDLSIGGACIVAVSSGIAEELLFRGVIISELARILPLWLSTFLSSLLFAYVHFIGALTQYWRVAILYLLFGLYFAGLCISTNNIFPSMIAHALYNFIAILYLRFIGIPWLSGRQWRS